jgi:hypothetical protein
VLAVLYGPSRVASMRVMPGTGGAFFSPAQAAGPAAGTPHYRCFALTSKMCLQLAACSWQLMETRRASGMHRFFIGGVVIHGSQPCS